jgi:hypothetical protein
MIEIIDARPNLSGTDGQKALRVERSPSGDAGITKREVIMNSRKALVRGIIILGIVSLGFLAGCGGGASQSVNNQPPPPSQPTAVTVSPASATVTASGVQQFAAVVTPSGANQAVTWSLSGTGCTGASCGAIDSTGRYTAPATVPSSPAVMVTATSVSDSTKFGSASVTVSPAPPPPSPSATLLIRDTPPVGVAVLSFSVIITGAVLQPGDVSLLTNPVSVEINRLQVDMSLLASLPIPSGTYNSLTVTLANPVLTILNQSGAAISSCPSGAICKSNPALAVSTFNFASQPFPITSTNASAPVLLLDFDLSQSLSDLGTINPVMTVQQPVLPNSAPLDVSLPPGGLSVKQVAGNIIYTGGDGIVDGAIFDLVTTNMGTLKSVDDFFAQYVDGVLCGGFFCVQGKIGEVDLILFAGADWKAKRVTLKPPDQPELEGVIVAINGGTQFDLVLLHQVPSAAGLEIGDVVRINLQSGATVEAVDIDPRTSSLLFSAPADLLVGQVVTARAPSAPSGTPPAVTSDRVRLKSGALTCRVKSVLNATDFVVDSLPGNFSSVQVQVHTDAQTGFLGISAVAGLNVGDKVSLSGFLLKTTGDPVLLAEGVRKR